MELEGPLSDLLMGAMRIVMSSCMSCFDIFDLAQMYCSSKSLKKLCQSTLKEGNKQAAYDLLVQSVRAAAKVSEFEERLGNVQHARVPVKAVAWLLETSGLEFFSTMDHVTEETARRLLHTPNIPSSFVAVLVAAGLRYTYAQLITAARSAVRGLSVWIPTKRMQGQPSGMPAYAQAIWYSREFAHLRLAKVIPALK